MANNITTDSVRAFAESRKFKRGNMQVTVADGFVTLQQHGNTIGLYAKDNGVESAWISCSGWYSVTTKQRLNELLRVGTWGRWSLQTVKGEWTLVPRDHGQSLTFKGSVYMDDLRKLDSQIADDKAERHARLDA